MPKERYCRQGIGINIVKTGIHPSGDQHGYGLIVTHLKQFLAPTKTLLFVSFAYFMLEERFDFGSV